MLTAINCKHWGEGWRGVGKWPPTMGRELVESTFSLNNELTEWQTAEIFNAARLHREGGLRENIARRKRSNTPLFTRRPLYYSLLGPDFSPYRKARTPSGATSVELGLTRISLMI